MSVSDGVSCSCGIGFPREFARFMSNAVVGDLIRHWARGHTVWVHPELIPLVFQKATYLRQCGFDPFRRPSGRSDRDDDDDDSPGL